MFPWCIFFFDKPWIFSLVMIVQIEYDDDESDKYDEEPGNCLEMEEESISLRGLPPPPLLLIYLDKHSLGNGQR